MSTLWCGRTVGAKAATFAKLITATPSAKGCNPVPILRYLCNACKHTCSRLPACIAPRRWFDLGHAATGFADAADGQLSAPVQ
ncbi:MAG: hypothetical protein IPN53_15175 [Comamonadaceae bacterium]|nr:hypothetical protein [Comamonadaceae bacterium]